MKIDSVIFKSKTTLKIHMVHHHNKNIDLKDEETCVPVVDEEEWLRYVVEWIRFMSHGWNGSGCCRTGGMA